MTRVDFDTYSIAGGKVVCRNPYKDAACFAPILSGTGYDFVAYKLPQKRGGKDATIALWWVELLISWGVPCDIWAKPDSTELYFLAARSNGNARMLTILTLGRYLSEGLTCVNYLYERKDRSPEDLFFLFNAAHSRRIGRIGVPSEGHSAFNNYSFSMSPYKVITLEEFRKNLSKSLDTVHLYFTPAKKVAVDKAAHRLLKDDDEIFANLR